MAVAEKKSFAQNCKIFYAKIKKGYEKLDGAKPVVAWLVLIGVATACLLLCLLPFLFKDGNTVWTYLAGDASTQFVTYLSHIKEVGWFKAVGDYDYYMGLGADYLSSLSFYSLFDPFNIFYMIFPFGDLVNYTLTMALKQLACAITMFAYLRYKKVRNSRALILSIAYMLTGYIAYTFVRHYNLATAPIYFPLVMLGVEKLHKGERPFVFVLSLFFALVSNFYLFFSVSVFTVAYSIAYYFHDSAQKGRKISVGGFFAKLVPIGLYYLLGVALAGVLLLPSAYGFLHSARSGSKGLDFFSFEVFLTQTASLVLPVPGRCYSSLCLNLANAVLALYALFKMNKKTRIYGVFCILLTVGYLLPVFGYAMNIFNYSNNRWSYGLSFFVFAMLGVQSTEANEEEYDEKTTKKINLAFIVYFAVIVASGLPALLDFLDLSAWYWGILCLAIALGIGYGGFVLCKKVWKGKIPAFFKKIYQPTMLYTLGFVLTVVSCFGFYCVYSLQYNGKEKHATLFSKEEKYIAEQLANAYPFGGNLGIGTPSAPSGAKDYYYRTDVSVADEWYDNFSNRAINNGYYGTSMYNTVSDGGVYQFLTENGVYNPALNLGISGLDERFALQSLLSVRYGYDRRGGMYGFKETPVAEGLQLYENENYIPFGFTIPKTQTYSRGYYLEQNTLDRQYLLLNGIVLDIEKGSADGGYTSSLKKQTIWGADGLQTLKKGKPRTFALEVGKDISVGDEVYFVMNEVNEVGGLTFFDIACNGVKKQYYYADKGNLMYTNERSMYLNFGVVGDTLQPTAENKLEFSVELLKGSQVISFDSVEIHSSPASAQTDAIESLQNSASLTGNVLKNKIVGQISPTQEGYLLLTLPYSKGWTAYINGEKTEILQADTAFMAIEVSPSQDGKPLSVEIRYQTPWLKAGKWVSVGGLGIFLGVLLLDSGYRGIRYSARKKSVKKQESENK